MIKVLGRGIEAYTKIEPIRHKTWIKATIVGALMHLTSVPETSIGTFIQEVYAAHGLSLEGPFYIIVTRGDEAFLVDPAEHEGLMEKINHQYQMSQDLHVLAEILSYNVDFDFREVKKARMDFEKESQKNAL